MVGLPASPLAIEQRLDRAHAVVRVLDEDPDLLGAPGDDAGTAYERLAARTIRLEAGAWTPLNDDVPRDFDGWLGLLVLDGLLVRQVRVGRLRCCELLGRGDLLRPWDEDDQAGRRSAEADWRVLEPTRLALLDAGFAQRASRWPTVSAELMHRTLSRCHSLSVLLAITQARRADVRLRTLFSHLADRWGRVTPDGVVLPMLLTHSVIAQLTGLRRPSVSLTLADLERTGEIVRRSKDCWLLRAR